MYIAIEKNQNGSYTFSGYLKRTYYNYSLKECKRKYKEESIKTGLHPHTRFIFVMI